MENLEFYNDYIGEAEAEALREYLNGEMEEAKA